MNIFFPFLRSKIPAVPTEELIRRENILMIAEPEIPPDFMKTFQPEVMLKESGSVAAFICGNGCYFGKICKFRGMGRAILRAHRVPRVFRCYAGAKWLIADGFTTPPPVAAAVRTFLRRIPIAQYLLTERLPENTVYLDKFCRSCTPEDRENLLRELLKFTARLHLAGWRHGDMSLRNLYLLPEPENFGMIDLDALEHYTGSVPAEVAAPELARLISSMVRSAELTKIPAGMVERSLELYQEFGGPVITPAEIRKKLERLMKHKAHPKWQGKTDAKKAF